MTRGDCRIVNTIEKLQNVMRTGAFVLYDTVGTTNDMREDVLPRKLEATPSTICKYSARVIAI
jgi:hypothetical protein